MGYGVFEYINLAELELYFSKCLSLCGPGLILATREICTRFGRQHGNSGHLYTLRVNAGPDIAAAHARLRWSAGPSCGHKAAARLRSSFSFRHITGSATLHPVQVPVLLHDEGEQLILQVTILETGEQWKTDTLSSSSSLTPCIFTSPTSLSTIHLSFLTDGPADFNQTPKQQQNKEC